MEFKRGHQRKRALSLRGYILENWDGISSLPEGERLGAIEGQVRHTTARRMKGIGAGWTDAGADHMTRVFAAKSNGELEQYTSHSKKLRREAFQGIDRILKEREHKGEDLEEWLKATLPALKGPFADRTRVKYVLKEITSLQQPA